MVVASICSITEPFGKWILVNLQLGDLGVLVGGDCHELCVWDRDDDLRLIFWLEYKLHHILMHCVKQNLQGNRKG